MLVAGLGPDREYHFPKVLEDDDWKWVNVVGFPDLYCADIDEGIGLYRSSQGDAASSYPWIGDALELSLGSLRAALARLDRTLSKPDFSKAVECGREGQLPLTSDEIKAVPRDLMQEWRSPLKYSDELCKRVCYSRGRPTTRKALRDLVRYLAWLFHEYTGEEISPSGKSFEFIWRVCQIADDKLPKNIVKIAVRQIRDEDEYALHRSDLWAPPAVRGGRDRSSVVIKHLGPGEFCIEARQAGHTHRRALIFLDAVFWDSLFEKEG